MVIYSTSCIVCKTCEDLWIEVFTSYSDERLSNNPCGNMDSVFLLPGVVIILAKSAKPNVKEISQKNQRRRSLKKQVLHFEVLTIIFIFEAFQLLKYLVMV